VWKQVILEQNAKSRKWYEIVETSKVTSTKDVSYALSIDSKIDDLG